MTSADPVIRGGTVMTPQGRVRGGIAVADGVIVAVAPDDRLPAGRETIDASGRYVLPGVIDSHVSSANPARAWGLSPKKGALQVGSDADVILVDMAREGEIRGAELHSKSKITPFEGTRIKGRPVCTIVRGRVVMRDGELIGAPGWGRPVVPAPAPPIPRSARARCA